MNENYSLIGRKWDKAFSYCQRVTENYSLIGWEWTKSSVSIGREWMRTIFWLANNEPELCSYWEIQWMKTILWLGENEIKLFPIDRELLRTTRWKWTKSTVSIGREWMRTIFWLAINKSELCSYWEIQWILYTILWLGEKSSFLLTESYWELFADWVKMN